MNTSFPEYEKKRDGDNFVRCGECDRLKSLQMSSTRGSHTKELRDMKFNEHNALACFIKNFTVLIEIYLLVN